MLYVLTVCVFVWTVGVVGTEGVEGIVWETTACRHHLVGNRFELITDSAVVAALASKDVPNRRKNWLVRLSQFDFFVTLKKGEQNRNADFFSRYTEDAVEAFDNREQKNEQSELQLNNIETAEADTELRMWR